MLQLNLLTFREPKRLRCNLCDRSNSVDTLVLFAEEGVIIGDLKVCGVCAQALRQALGNGGGAEEVVEKVWSF